MKYSSINSVEQLNNIYDGVNSRHLLLKLIFERILELKISQRTLSDILSIERKSLQRFLSLESNKIDTSLTLKLINFLGIDISTFIEYYSDLLKQDEMEEISFTKRAVYILTNFDIGMLKKINLIKATTSIKEIEKILLEFFKINSIFEYDLIYKQPLYSKIKRPTKDIIEKFWISSAIQQVNRINNPYPYNRERVIEKLLNLKLYLPLNENGFIKVIKSLFNDGVTVFFQASIPNVQLRAATLIHSHRPAIIMSDHIKTLSTAWFALFHELYHVLFEYDQIQSIKFHMTKVEGQDDLYLSEEKANRFARDYILKADKLDYIKNFIDSPAIVENFAKKNNITKSFIYDLYLFDSSLNGDSSKYKYYSKHLHSSKNLINQVTLEPWNGNHDDQDLEIINYLYNS